MNPQQKIIISKEGSVRNGFREASLAYTDVYDFLLKRKKSLKKWEIELGLHHQELESDFDEPPARKKIGQKQSSIVGNDVMPTEASISTIDRQIGRRGKLLADLAGGTP